MKQRMTTILRGAVAALALIAALAGCSDLISPPAASGPSGKITLTIGGPGRAALPSLDQFEKITLSFVGKDGAENLPDADITGGSVTVEIAAAGSWEVSAKAYIGEADSAPAADSNIQTISWAGPGSEVTGDAWFTLSPTAEETDPGTLRFTVALPEDISLGTGSRIRIEQNGAPLEDLDSGGFVDGVQDISASIEAADLSLAAGRYAVEILIVKDDNTVAACRETAVILPGLITAIAFAPGAEDFLDPATPAAQIGGEGLSFAVTTDSSSVKDMDFTADPSPSLSVTAATGYQTVYFTLTKGEEQAVEIGGTDAADVTLVAAGDDAGDSVASATLAVFVVSNVDQGDKAFTITITEPGKAGSVTVAVTVSEEAAVGGFGLYSKAIAEPESAYAKIDFAGTTLNDALIWLADAGNVAANMSYLVEIDADQEIQPWVSTYTTLNVEITLRGIGMVGGENWKISWDGKNSVPYKVFTSSNTYYDAVGSVGLLTVLRGVTLILDNGITLDGENIPIAVDGWVKNDKFAVMIYIPAGKSGAQNVNANLIMQPGSKIANVYNNSSGSGIASFYGTAVNINANSSSSSGFTMNGGEISGNTGYLIINNKGGNFIMDGDSAKITENSLVALANSGDSATAEAAGTAVASSGSFLLKDGEISNHNFRGVHITSGSFTMEGGKITGNGTSLYSDGAAVPGPGLYIDISGKGNGGVMTGGEISGNGSENSIGSAFILYTGTSTSFDIYGNVSISGSIALKVVMNATKYLRIGSNFSNTEGELTINAIGANNNNFNSLWKEGAAVLAPIDSAELNVIDKFVLGGFYILDSDARDWIERLTNLYLKEDGTLGTNQ
jgi:hypothetical protein